MFEAYEAVDKEKASGSDYSKRLRLVLLPEVFAVSASCLRFVPADLLDFGLFATALGFPLDFTAALGDGFGALAFLPRRELFVPDSAGVGVLLDWERTQVTSVAISSKALC